MKKYLKNVWFWCLVWMLIWGVYCSFIHPYDYYDSNTGYQLHPGVDAPGHWMYYVTGLVGMALFIKGLTMLEEK